MSKYYPDFYHGDNIANWDEIKSNCPFVIFKATEGTSFVDSKLETYISECESRGIPYWVYAFLKKGNEKAQTQFMVSTCKEIVKDCFIGYVLDVESENSLSDVKAAMDYLKTVGPKMMFYCMSADYDTYQSIIESRPNRCAYWEARYGVNDGSYNSKYPPKEEADLHQFTSVGSCPGISNKCDLNRVTGNGKKEAWFKSPRPLHELSPTP
ncbi:MAG: hypothetical protein LUF92_14055 [Clostridiales bacterium]|nr:hypothetical protein [Clostridiales bacterium]